MCDHSIKYIPHTARTITMAAAATPADDVLHVHTYTDTNTDNDSFSADSSAWYSNPTTQVSELRLEIFERTMDV